MEMLDLCQCPLRAGPHFYPIDITLNLQEKDHCVNALYGRDLISTRHIQSV